MASFLVRSTNKFAMTTMAQPQLLVTKAVLHTEAINRHFDGTVNKVHHYVLATSCDNDTYTLKEMLQQDDCAEFITAMVKEITDHEERGHWTVLPRSAIPRGMKTIMSVWSFKRKRFPDGRILKHKARLCTHGGM